MRVKSVYAEITNRCNLNCATCYNRSGLNSAAREMPVEEIGKIITLFRPLGLEKLHLSGGGCILAGACGKGCMAEDVDLTGDPFGDDGNCEGRKQQLIVKMAKEDQ